MTELEREIKINECFLKIRALVEAGKSKEAVPVFNQAARLIRLRSAKQIQRMERERGLM